tara:strand:+ start:5674 stop:5892 length:219 start_codon:yes stop_codon:yes gene_type:complete
MFIRKRHLKSVLNFFVVLIVALVGFTKVISPIGLFLVVPSLMWLAYTLSNALLSDLLYGETMGCSEKSIYKD